MVKEAGLIGLSRLVEDLRLRVPLPAVRSEAVQGARRTKISGASILEQYPLSYAPTDLFGQLRFAMRYEPVDVGVLAAAFEKVSREEMEKWVRAEHIGKYVRRAWYLYELSTGETLDVPDLIPSGYVDLLDDELHITGPTTQVRRQRINDNLLGTKDYSPLVRRTEALSNLMALDLAGEARKIVESCDPAILARAVHYLFTKETKSSFAIEGEVPSKERTARFVKALEKAAEFDATRKEAFVQLQNAIVEPRYAQQGWRTTQNYVAQTLRDFTEDVHFVCPKPEDVAGLMTAWMNMEGRLEGSEQTDAIAAAAAAAFGFVFIHPFEDGNGRIHRFIVHHMLAKRGVTPEGILFPVSAAMLRDRGAYDRVLEKYSSSILPFIDYDLDNAGRLTVHNDTVRLYRYFDATAHVEYLYRCIEETIRRDLRDEVGFLKVFDGVVQKVMEIVDMPDRKATLLVRLILQNKGKLSGAKRPSFAELSDEEVQRMENVVWGAWEAEHAKSGQDA